MELRAIEHDVLGRNHTPRFPIHLQRKVAGGEAVDDTAVGTCDSGIDGYKVDPGAEDGLLGIE